MAFPTAKTSQSMWPSLHLKLLAATSRYCSPYSGSKKCLTTAVIHNMDLVFTMVLTKQGNHWQIR